MGCGGNGHRQGGRQVKKRPSRPLWLHVYGVGRVWRARVAARLGKTGRWRKLKPEIGREVTSTSPAMAAKKALTAFAREPAVCSRCGETWERMRGRKRALCPRCQNRRREDGRSESEARG
jgi:hypothetical protein